MLGIREEDFENSINYALLRKDIGNIRQGGKIKIVDEMLTREESLREKERAIRATLNSSDGNTAEIHDQVTW